MTCDQCGQQMYLNGSMWQCPAGHLKPRFAPEPTGALLPVITTER